MSPRLAVTDDAITERTAGRRAGVMAFGSVAATIGALIAANSATTTTLAEPGGAGVDRDDADRRDQLVEFAASTDAQTIAVALRAVGVLLCIGVGLYLLWLVRRRGSTIGDAVKLPIVAGPVLVVIGTVFGYVAFKDVAETFVASGPQTAARAVDLIDDDSTLQAAGLVDLVARVVFAAWVGILSLQAMRVGLLTSFLGYWGVAAAGALVVLPIGDAMFIGWLASIAFLAVGYWPGGRPEAWERRVAFDGPAP
jgi:hypothetical protein